MAVNARVALMLLFVLAASPLRAETAHDLVQLAGYYKNLYSTSQTASHEGYFSDLNRLRLEATVKPNDSWAAYVAFDNEILVNDFSHTADFSTISSKNQHTFTAWDADYAYMDTDHAYGKTSLYRGYVKYTSDRVHVTAGKQAIDWSRMRFYGPLDIFNPVSPLDLERDERLGIDAINLEYFPSPFALINLIYAPYRDMEKGAAGAKASMKIKDYDCSIVAVDYHDDVTAGVGFDGYLWQAGFRGEAGFTWARNRSDFTRASIGFDHNFTSKLYGVAEYFYNGGSNNDVSSFTSSFSLSRTAQSIYQHILSTGAEYEINGVTKLAQYVYFDLEKGSVFYNPEVRWNAASNLDLSLGCQLYWGKENSEYGSYQNLYYAQAKLYF